MRRPRAWLLARRILIGVVLGAVAGVALKYAAYGMPQGPVEEASEFANVAWLAGIVAALGGIAGGALGGSGWKLLVGAVVGALVFAALGVLGTLNLMGAAWALLGGPFGALVVFLADSARDEARAAARGRTQGPTEAR